MTAPAPGVRELLAASAGLAALVLLFLATPILSGGILSPADTLFTLPPWRHVAPPGFEPSNNLLGDYVMTYRPWRDFALPALKAGRLPLWNPMNYGGAPLLGSVQSAVLYPLNLPFLVLPERPALVVWAAVRLLVAGIFTYAAARLIGVSPAGAMLGAVAFGFCGYLVVWLLFPAANTALWLPALVVATEALARRPTAPRAVALAAVVCVLFLGGYPPGALHLLFAATLWLGWRAGAAWRAEGDGRALGRRLGAFAGGVALGTGAAALQLVPFAEYFWHGAAWDDRRSLAPDLWAVPGYPKTLSLLALVCPDCFGSARRGQVWLGDAFQIWNFNELNGAYVGVLTLVLAGVAVACGRPRGVERFLLVSAALFFCVIYGIPPVYNAFHALPPFRFTVNSRTMVVLAFLLALLAGRGLDRVADLADATRRRVRWSAWVALGLAGAAVVAWCVVARRYARAGAFTVHGHPIAAGRILGFLKGMASEQLLLLALSGLVLGVLCSGVGRRPLARWLVVAVLVVDLFAFGRDYNPTIPLSLDRPTQAAIEFVRRQPGLFRVLGVEATLWPNTNMDYGLQEVRGYDTIGPALYHRFLDATGPFPQPPWLIHMRTLLFANVESRLVDLLNVRYVLADREVRHPKLRLVLADGVRVYENRAVLPRAFLVYESRVLGDAGAVERALRDPGFEPARTVLLETGPALSGPPDPDGTAEVTRYEPERVDVAVRTSRDAVLLLADTWFPGWQVSVDGAPAALLRADLALRAVAVPAGEHQVSFRYRPASVRVGAAVSGLSVVAAGVLLAAARRQRK